MSIRMVAVELYRVMKQIGEFEKELKGVAEGSPEGEQLRKRLLEACALKDQLQKMIEGAKGD
ncbi:MAG: hypothetical protein ACP5IL_12090 [Syntrophobacteraceae bacterium]